MKKEAAALPAGLAAWARAHIGEHMPWPLPVDLTGAQSWRISSPQGLIDIRVPRTDSDYRREVYAHRHAIRRLDPSRGPRLIATEPRLRALLTTQPRARPIDEAAALHILPRIHQDSGHLLRTLHDNADHLSDTQAQAQRHTAHFTHRILRILDPIATWLDPAEADYIRICTTTLLQHVDGLPIAFCHGTFGPGCWQWNAQRQTLSFTDFGRAQVLPAVIDFARTTTLWAEHPHLADAFFNGYGRTLSDDELSVLNDAAILAAVEDLHHATLLRNSDALSSAGASLRAAIRRRTSEPSGNAALPSAEEGRHP